MTGMLLRSISGKYDPISSIAWSRDGRWVATDGAKSHDEIGAALRVWDVNSRSLLPEKRYATSQTSGPVFHPDGRHLITSEGSDLVVYELA